MISKKVEDAINAQINREMFSGYLYMAMSSSATSQGLKGVATWFMVQYHEEMVHAMKMYEYIQRQGGHALIHSIKEPQADFKSALDMFEMALAHEKTVTKNINDLLDLAVEEKDHATHAFLQWYITEQIEEEENANDIILKLKMAGDNSGGLYMIDKELSTRMVTVPTDFSKGVEVQLAGGAAN